MTKSRCHRIAGVLATGLAAGVLAAPAAVARPAMDPPSTTVAARPDTPIVRTIDDGFDWGAAAIGAGGGGVIVLVSLGGFVMTSREHSGVLR